MTVDRDTVLRVAKLARVSLPDEEIETLVGELSNILDWIEQLDEVDTTGVKPMTSVSAVKLRWRSDLVTEDDISKKIREVAPDPKNGMFSVPKVVD